MKRIFLIVSILFLLIGCNKEEEISLEQQIIGKWQLIEERTNKITNDNIIDFTTQWIPIIDGEILTFKEDFTYLNTSYQCAGTYVFYISNDISPMIFVKPSCLNPEDELRFIFEINGDEIVLFSNSVCPYGCSFKYKRIE